MATRGRAGPPADRSGGTTLTLLLLDTTFLVDAERAGTELDGLIADEDGVAIAAVTVAELLVGVALAKGKRRARRQAFVDVILESVPVLPYDERVARAHAGLLTSVRQSGRPRAAHDLIIAATAIASDRIVITADDSGFHDLPGLDYRQHPAED